MKIIEGTAHQEVAVPVPRRLHESAKQHAARRGLSVTELYRRLLVGKLKCLIGADDPDQAA